MTSTWRHTCRPPMLAATALSGWEPDGIRYAPPDAYVCPCGQAWGIMGRAWRPVTLGEPVNPPQEAVP